MTRNQFDGLPYYCSTCGDPYPDAPCDESPALCKLETAGAAEARQRRRRPMTTAKPLGEQT
jgi:hypothetical protein